MRLVDLAKQLHVTEGALRQNESAELDESITMKHLRRAAEGMGCELVYAIVPRTSLENLYEDQIRKRAVSDANRTARTMDLEQQGVSREVTDRQVEDLFREYMRDPPRDLWDE
jgi:predicted DNA-binding mobile mystery protein A